MPLPKRPKKIPKSLWVLFDKDTMLLQSSYPTFDGAMKDFYPDYDIMYKYDLSTGTSIKKEKTK